MSPSHSTDETPDASRAQVFLRLYQANERRIYGFILALVPDWFEAEDLLQETTAVMWSKFDQFELGTDFAAWAMRIARYQIMNYRKKKRNQRVQFSDEVLGAIEEHVTTVTKDLDIRRDALRDCLKKLSARDRELVHLRYEYDATTKAVAARVGRGIDAVYKALNRIHVQLFYCVRRTLAMERSL